MKTNYTEAQYRYALKRIEQLLPVVTDDVSTSAPEAIELGIMSDIVMAYEEEHYPIDKLSVGELIRMGLEESAKTPSELAAELGVPASRINDFVSGRGEPSLSQAGSICRTLHINPAIMLGV